MGVVLAAVSALLFGIADYCGGVASRRSSATAASFVAYASSVVGLAFPALVAPISAPISTEFVWGAASGFCSAVGVVLLYAAFTAGPMTIVAPVSAVLAAVVPVGIGVVIQESPGPLALLGVGCAVVAIGLICWVPGRPASALSRRMLALATLSGVSFGFYFVFLQRAVDAGSSDSALWPMTAFYVAGTTVMTLAAWRQRAFGAIIRDIVPWAVPAGLLGAIGTVCAAIAFVHAPLAIAAPIASLYPASTVLLALVRDGERLRLSQGIGLVFAAGALMLAARY